MSRKGEKLFGSKLFDRSRNGPIPLDLTQMSSGANNYVRDVCFLEANTNYRTHAWRL